MLGGMRGVLRRLRGWWAGPMTPGGRGEKAAAEHLRGKGYRILACNLRSRIGEIDILAEDPATRCIVVVEVKMATRSGTPPEVRVNGAKQRKLTVLAAGLIKRHRLQNRVVRFDVIGIVWPDGAAKPERLSHHVNAFESRI